MSASADLSSPLPQRLKAWIDERFPLANAPAFFLFYLTAAFVAAHDRGGAVQFSFTDLVSCLAVWSMFLLLRVFDEHKDYAEDVIYHSDRVLQRGLITLGHLKIVGAVCFAFTLLWSLARGGGFGAPAIAWIIMTGWACLMAVEFFCSVWLKERLTIYALSHMAIMPLVAWWCVTLKSPTAAFTSNVALLALLFFLTGLAFELGRKTRGPEEERDGVDSYSKIFGTRESAVLVLIVTIAIVALIEVLVAQMQAPPHAVWLFAPAIVGGLPPVAAILMFLRTPSASGRKKTEASLGLLALFGYGAIITAVIVSNGFVWT